MVPLQESSLYKVILFLLFLTSSLISARKTHNNIFLQRRVLLELQDDVDQPPNIKKKSAPTIAPKIPSKNQTKLIKSTFNSSKNKTKLSNSTSPPTLKAHLKKLNSSSNSASLDLLKLSSKSKTTKPTTKNLSKAHLQNDLKGPNSNAVQPNKDQNKQPPKPKPNSFAAADDDEDDAISDFRNLPSKFQESFVPDMEKLSKSSKTYIKKYNKEFTMGFKPYVGNKYAPAVASVVSFAFILVPLILVSLIFNRIKAYFSLQRLVIFIQIYLAIYFTILCLSAFATGLEPLRFFYATSKSTYVGVQVLQTLVYVLYLLLLLMYLVLVFSTETGLAMKLLGLGQTFVGFAVGLHYYMTVFHRAVLRQPPRTSWKAHGLYATFFFLICVLGSVDRKKKAYLEEGGEEGKQS